MKKIIAGIVLGLFLQKSIAGIYSYVWWSAEEECRVVENKDELDCINEQVGNWKVLNYILLEPNYSWQEWKIRR